MTSALDEELITGQKSPEMVLSLHITPVRMTQKPRVSSPIGDAITGSG
jgi:hypothetical protein